MSTSAHKYQQNHFSESGPPEEARPDLRQTEKIAPAKTETNIETLPERAPQTKGEGFLADAIDGMRKALGRPKKQRVTKIPQVRDELTVKIENIMADGLAEAYRVLPVIQQQEFKIKGEQTALKIRDLLKSTHLKVKKIFRLILEWLRLLPGINRFFLEQEAKIKVDKIVALKQIYKDKIV